jgi:hypothetical protein
MATLKLSIISVKYALRCWLRCAILADHKRGNKLDAKWSRERHDRSIWIVYVSRVPPRTHVAIIYGSAQLLLSAHLKSHLNKKTHLYLSVMNILANALMAISHNEKLRAHSRARRWEKNPIADSSSSLPQSIDCSADNSCGGAGNIIFCRIKSLLSHPRAKGNFSNEHWRRVCCKFC